MREVEFTDIKSAIDCDQYCRIVHVSVCATTTSSATLHVVHSIPYF